MAEGLDVGAKDGDIISVAFIENVALKVLALTCSTLSSSISIVAFNDNVELTVSAVTCTKLSSCMSICLSFLFRAIAAAEPAEAKIAREIAKSFAAVQQDGRFMVVLLY